METNRVHRRYVSHTVQGRDEYFHLSVMSNEEGFYNDYYFKLEGIGVEEQTTAETLKEVKQRVEDSIQVSEGRYPEEDTGPDTPMTSAHYEKVLDFIKSEIDEHGKYVTPVEWVKEVK